MLLKDLIGIGSEILLVWNLCFFIVKLTLDSLNTNKTELLIVASLHQFIFILVLCILNIFMFYNVNYGYVCFDTIYISGYTQVAKTILYAMMFLMCICSIPYLKTYKINYFEFTGFLWFSTIGFSFLISANTAILLYLALELQAFSFYVLASLEKENFVSIEAALKYFVFGSIASGIIAYGFTYIYLEFGTLNFKELALTNFDIYLSEHKLVIDGILCILTGFFLKLYVAPFHMWIADIYQGAPVPVTMLFATIPWYIYIGVCIKLFLVVFKDVFINVFDLNILLVIFSCFSLICGTLGAMMQCTIRKFIAYSSVNHIGFILLCFLYPSLEGVVSLLQYVFFYLISTFSFFCLLLSIKDTDTNKSLEYLYQLKGLHKQYPILALCFILILFSFAGIPPLAGFFVKFQILQIAVNLQLGYYFLCVALLTTIISVYYYLHIIKILIFPIDTLRTLKITSFYTCVIGIVNTSILATFILWMPYFYDFLTYCALMILDV